MFRDMQFPKKPITLYCGHKNQLSAQNGKRIPKMGGERQPTQIIMAKLINYSKLICVHGLPPPKVGFGTAWEEDKAFIAQG